MEILEDREVELEELIKLEEQEIHPQQVRRKVIQVGVQDQVLLVMLEVEEEQAELEYLDPLDNR
jgi:hypothetical protein